MTQDNRPAVEVFSRLDAAGDGSHVWRVGQGDINAVAPSLPEQYARALRSQRAGLSDRAKTYIGDLILEVLAAEADGRKWWVTRRKSGGKKYLLLQVDEHVRSSAVLPTRKKT